MTAKTIVEPRETKERVNPLNHSVRATKTLRMNSASRELEKQLRQLVVEISGYPIDSVERQSAFSKVVQLVMRSRKLWRESTPYYPDALQEMWEYCFQNIDHPEQGYNPDICGVVTWLDDRLKKILRRHRDRARRQRSRQAFSTQLQDGQVLDPVDRLMAPPDPQSALDLWIQLLEWVKADPEEILSSRVCLRYPHINAQTLLLRRLPPDEQSWDIIATDLSANKTYIAQWYSRYCNPLLRTWGKSQGYLDNTDI